MKSSLKRLALVLAAAMLLCFALTGCEGGAVGGLDTDLEGNEVASTTYKKSGSSWIITREYVVDPVVVGANGRALAAQEVTVNSNDTVTKVSRVYKMSKPALSDLASGNELLNSLSDLVFTDNEEIKHITFTFTYSNSFATAVQVVYYDDSNKKVTVKYDGNFDVTSGTSDKTVMYPVMSLLLNQTIGNSVEFKEGFTTLAYNVYCYGDNLAYDTWAERQNLEALNDD